MTSKTIYEYKFHIIYETTNLINGKKYRGAHSTNDLQDSYIGSGNAIKQAFIKYGRENFKKEILFCAFTRECLYEIEGIFVDHDWIIKEDTYNIVVGGMNGKTLPTKTHVEKIKITKTDRYGSDSYNNQEKICQTRLDRYGDSGYTNTKKATETCMEKYGVMYPSQSSEIMKKMLESRKRNGSHKGSNNSKAKLVKITTPDGLEWFSNGNLDDTLKILSEKYKISFWVLKDYRKKNKRKSAENLTDWKMEDVFI